MRHAEIVHSNCPYSNCLKDFPLSSSLSLQSLSTCLCPDAMACFLQVYECTLSLSMQPHLRLVIEKRICIPHKQSCTLFVYRVIHIRIHFISIPHKQSYALSLSRTNKVILYLCIVLFMFEYTLSLSRTNKVIICISCYSCSNTLYLSPLCSNTLYLYPAQTKLCFICTSCYSCSNALYLSPLCSNTLYLYPAQTEYFICASCYSYSNTLYLSPLCMAKNSISLNSNVTSSIPSLHILLHADHTSTAHVQPHAIALTRALAQPLAHGLL